MSSTRSSVPATRRTAARTSGSSSIDELSAQAAKTGSFDYDARIAGIEVRDRYTVSFKLVEPDFNFLYVLAMPNVVPVAREVIEAYGADTHAHRVGTGPYVLKEWVRRSKIVLERNPDHRGYELDTRYADVSDEWEDRRAIEALRGKRLPLMTGWRCFPSRTSSPASSPSSIASTTSWTSCPSRSSTRCCPTAGSRRRSRGRASRSSARNSPSSPTTSST